MRLNERLKAAERKLGAGEGQVRPKDRVGFVTVPLGQPDGMPMGWVQCSMEDARL